MCDFIEEVPENNIFFGELKRKYVSLKKENKDIEFLKMDYSILVKRITKANDWLSSNKEHEKYVEYDKMAYGLVLDMYALSMYLEKRLERKLTQEEELKGF